MNWWRAHHRECQPTLIFREKLEETAPLHPLTRLATWQYGRNIILADEIVGTSGRIDPPIFPFLRIAADFGPFDRGG